MPVHSTGVLSRLTKALGLRAYKVVPEGHLHPKAALCAAYPVDGKALLPGGALSRKPL